MANTIGNWQKAVETSYRSAVSAEEYAAKATPKALFAVAYYLMYTSGNDADTLALLDDTSDEEPNSTVRLLMDFQFFLADGAEE
jgi:hypothetical protein